MKVEEIFSQMSARMIKGLMVHQQLLEYYNFLGLKKYSEQQQYHYLKESKALSELNAYFINHYNILIPEPQTLENPAIIPQNWYKHIRQDVDKDTKRKYVEAGIETWIKWEKETKKIYESLYKELCDIGEVASALYVSDFIKGVDDELMEVEMEHLELEATNYSIDIIIQRQE